MRETDLDQLTAHAARNGGIVSIADCRRAGLLYSEVAARCRSGAWPRLARGTYLLDADLRSGPSRADPVRAAISSFGSDAVIGLHTAAELHGIGGAPSSPMVHIITPRTAGRAAGSSIRSSRRIRSTWATTMSR